MQKKVCSEAEQDEWEEGLVFVEGAGEAYVGERREERAVYQRADREPEKGATGTISNLCTLVVWKAGSLTRDGRA